jgi:hypothetical protein
MVTSDCVLSFIEQVLPVQPSHASLFFRLVAVLGRVQTNLPNKFYGQLSDALQTALQRSRPF